MSDAQQSNAPLPEDMTSWALALFARPEGAALPSPPAHDRLEHLAEVLGVGRDGLHMIALFYGLWRGAGTQSPISAAQARRATGDAAPHLRSLLVQWDILNEVAVAPGAPLALVLDETIGDWLEGGDPIPPRWHARVSLRASPDPLPGWPVADLAERASNALKTPQAGPLVITLAGGTGTGRHSLACATAQALGTTPIFADLLGLEPTQALTLIRLVERAALLTLRPPAYVGGEGLHLPEGLPGFALQFEITDGASTGLNRTHATRHLVTLGPLSLTDRAAAWAQLYPPFSEWSEADQQQLVHLKPAAVGEIARIAAHAPLNVAAALALLREDQLARLNSAIRPHRGTLGWDDLILPDRLTATLHRLSAEIALSPGLWQDDAMDRLYPQGRGVFALFSGPSGTGKTMAAQVIAASLGVDLYVVDAGAIISKYVGETAQNLQTILSQAEADAAVLFFDEADGLFGKRTDARDAHARYLNSDTNVLLQAVESYGGACIMASNRRDNIDPAFLRRFRYACEFPRPDAALRLRLWQGLAGALSSGDTQALDPLCSQLADTLDFTGAQIKNAMRTAAIEAQRAERDILEAPDMLTGAEHELMKEGRALTPAEIRRLGVHNG